MEECSPIGTNLRFRRVTGYGLAGPWGYVNEGDYARARASFDAVVEAFPDNWKQRSRSVV